MDCVTGSRARGFTKSVQTGWTIRSVIRAVGKRVADSWFPTIGVTYRNHREVRAAAHVVDTPFGFRLAGSKVMASGVFERDEIACFLEHLSGTSVCLDVGANV